MNNLPDQDNIAAEINRHHELACLRAGEAIDHAIEAGKLLLEVKASMAHGEFVPWLTTNIDVSARQCQRYMRAAQGKPMPIRAITAEGTETTPASHLAKDWTPRPAFIPLAGHWYWCSGPDGAMAYVIEPSARSPGYFYVSHLHDSGNLYDCTRRPIAAQWVETNLDYYGLKDAAAQHWHVRPSDGVDEALATLNAPATEGLSAAT